MATSLTSEVEAMGVHLRSGRHSFSLPHGGRRPPARKLRPWGLLVLALALLFVAPAQVPAAAAVATDDAKETGALAPDAAPDPAPALVAAPPAAPPAAATASGGFLRAAAKGVALVALIVCLLVAAVLSSAKFAGNAVKLAVESADRKLLGVDITVENAAVSFFQGIVEISGLKVLNPDKQEWASPYLARIDHVKVDIGMMRAIKSKGQEIEIEALVLEGVDVCYDMPSIGGSSNVNTVMDFVENKANGAPAPAPAASGTNSTAAAEPQATPAEESQVIVREVRIKAVGAGAYVSGQKVAGVQLGDIVFDDFAQKLDKAGGAVVGDVVKVILKTILNTVLSNQKIMSDAVQAAGGAALKGVSDSIHSAGAMGSSAAASVSKSLVSGSSALTSASNALAHDAADGVSKKLEAAQAGGSSLFSSMLGGASQGDSLYRDVVFGGRAVGPEQYRKVVFGASAELAESYFSAMPNPFGSWGR